MFWKWDPNICWKWDNRKRNWRKVHGREAFCLHTVQLLLHNCWQSQDTFANPFRRKTFQLHTVSRNTCWSIQERSLSGVTSGTIHALGLLCLFWGKQFEDTLKNAHWEKSDKCNQCDFASSVACYLRTHLKNTQWRKVKQMSGEQMYYNHLRQAFYGDT